MEDRKRRPRPQTRRDAVFDRQSRHWNTKVLVMVAIIVVVAAVIRVGHYSRRMEAASRKKHDPREGHNQAKAVLRARSLSLSPALANCNANPSRCNVFCRRVDDPAHRSATRNTTGDHFFAECVDRRHAIIPTILPSPLKDVFYGFKTIDEDWFFSFLLSSRDKLFVSFLREDRTKNDR